MTPQPQGSYLLIVLRPGGKQAATGSWILANNRMGDWDASDCSVAGGVESVFMYRGHMFSVQEALVFTLQHREASNF